MDLHICFVADGDAVVHERNPLADDGVRSLELEPGVARRETHDEVDA